MRGLFHGAMIGTRVGLTRAMVPKRIRPKLVVIRTARVPTVHWTWRGMCGSGWQTGMMRLIMPVPQRAIHRERLLVVIAYCVADRGTMSRAALARRPAFPTNPATEPVTSVFVAPSSFHLFMSLEKTFEVFGRPRVNSYPSQNLEGLATTRNKKTEHPAPFFISPFPSKIICSHSPVDDHSLHRFGQCR